jgi:AbiJ N-terminal domain 4
MKSFSQRKGLKPVIEVLQVDAMTPELRNSLWNALDIRLWSVNGFVYGSSGYAGAIDDFSRLLWFQYFKKPMDQRPGNGHPNRGAMILKVIRDEFFSCAWNEVYDFLEFVVRARERADRDLAKFLNAILEREMAGYRLIDGHAVNITSEHEKAMLEEALSDTKFAGAASHLARALEMLADRKSPDYRNSIKESISAVEAMARVVAGSPKATLGDALKALEKSGKLHTALKEGFSKLYGYASDEAGIRHAMLDEPNISQADAKYFLLSCTSFVNYLKASL